MFLVADTIQEFKLVVSPETSLIEIIDLIEELKKEDKVPQQLFVIHNLQLLGTLKLLDLMYLINSKRNLEKVKVLEVMKPAITLESDYDYQQALLMMREYDITYLPIINKTGELIEIITPQSIATKLQAELINTQKQLQEKTNKYDYLKQEFDDLLNTNNRLQHKINDSIAIEKKLHFRVAFEQLITTISTDFINLDANEIDKGINQTLQIISTFINVDRSYVFLLAEDYEKLDNTHEWCAEKFLSRIEQLKDIYVEDLNLFIEKLRSGEILQLIDIENLQLQEPVKEQVFKIPDIKSLIILPIDCSGNLIGFLGFESFNTILWTEDSIILLKIVAKILGNILGRKGIEETLKVREERYARAINAGKVGVWEWDIQTNKVYIDSNLKAMLGYQDEEIANQFTSWLEFVHSSDVGLVKAEINAYLEELIPKYEIEHRMLHKNGDILDFLTRGKVLRDENGIPTFMAGSSTDITARKQIENKLKTSLKEKEVLLKEIHHRVKNNLQIISSLLRLQSGYIKDKQALEVFQDSQNRIRAMALIHENLYQVNNLAEIEFSEYIRKLTNNLISFYAIHNKIKINTNIEKGFLKIDTAIPCALIINELISNSIKHAFKNSDEGEIYVEFIALQENKYSLSVSDNGIGVQESIDSLKKQSLGLELVWNLVEQLEGTIVYNCKFGTSFRITFTENKDG
ncbi:MAG: histidine kinase dimerization/phosphoacceptor domain -containing protein [Nostocales cyanobacterium 94392]|nr:histidine kinase dimerization/phosphoacceptor domain -containing protein [Nostocales cyanobacterium 94392]